MQKESALQMYDGIVICSTQNQMVNYLTILKHFGEQHSEVNIIYITVAENYSQHDNKKWDKNLFKVLNRPYPKEPIEFNVEELSDHASIKEQLKIQLAKYFENQPSGTNKLLWNITGGQRHLAMAITQFVSSERKDDVIVYYEGNHNRFYYYPDAANYKDESIPDISYEKFNLKTAFMLMGFNTEDNKLEKSTYYHHFISATSETGAKKAAELLAEKDFYTAFYNDFVEYKNGSELLLKLMESNKNENNEHKLELFFNNLLSLEPKLPFLQEEKNVTTFEESLAKYSKTALFGYIFERMVFYKIIDVILKDKNLRNVIADIHLSAKATGEEDLGTIDEFDIAILTKSGKVTIFECKSGTFDGDDMKSHHYSTYAVAGVYGTPILMLPLTEKMCSEIGQKHKEGRLPKKEEAILKKFVNGKKYAEKANIKYWYIDQLGKNLKDLLKREVVKNV